jgi:hypothetical protein
MSNLAIAAAHLVGLPARIPTNTLFIFNAADLGLHILVRSTLNCVARKHDWSRGHQAAANLAARVVVCFAAVYVTSKLTEPMPLKTAALINFSAFILVFVTTAFFYRGKETK